MRDNGILLHISSLPSPWGIGTLGKEAYQFVDDLKKAGQKIWQILPFNPTGFGDSPYASSSVFAGNPYLIDLDELARQGLLEPEEYQKIDWGSDPEKVDYQKLWNSRFDVLGLAVSRFLQNPDPEFEDFCAENRDWLSDYALFMAIKNHHGGAPWSEWEPEFRFYSEERAQAWKVRFYEEWMYWQILQYFFFRQWQVLHQYASEHSVEIIGDIPIYAAMDSADVWRHPDLFMLDDNGQPQQVAGCPPDGFSADGQLWGNPVYRWEKHAETGYAWWIDRIAHMSRLVDVIRIDHFRGFDSYYSVSFGEQNARNGRWNQGPGMDLFNAIRNAIGVQNIMAEDLGYLTDSVKALLQETGYPGMKILQFAFDSRDASSPEYMPYRYQPNCYAYTGTHDNEVLNGWIRSVSEEDCQTICDYFGVNSPEAVPPLMIRELMSSAADHTILQMQDLLDLDAESRMNVPGRADGNWSWRMLPGAFDAGKQRCLRRLTKIFSRLDPSELQPSDLQS